ncbi:MAG: hypothetical protein HY862_07030 [Chloroflexi bacterium]|nr:hypothetical protein [Chloroflexota bacterium]
MSDKILVTYATRTGSTAEIAEAIGKTLVEKAWLELGCLTFSTDWNAAVA